MSDINIVGRGLLGTDDVGVVLYGACQDFRIFNNKFTQNTFGGLFVFGEGVARQQRGVIYNNSFIKNYTTNRGTNGYGVSLYANSQTDTAFGTQDAVYIENNVFTGNRHSIASNSGARYVARYNSFTTDNEVKNFGQLDAHGPGNPGNTGGGTASWEVYNNSFLSTINDGGTGWAMSMRGGDGIVFNNTFASGYVQAIGLTVETGCPGGTYPVPGQTRSLYIWGNNVNAVRPYDFQGGNCDAYFIQGRDYFLAAKPGYTPYTYPHPLRQK
jgi:hypothetical protein